MRLWSIHPKYLDTKRLVALWREALLAQAVLAGKTKGYKRHPQLTRFRSQPDPLAAIGNYLWYIYLESVKRGYTFDVSRIASKPSGIFMHVTKGQLDYEAKHLSKKLKVELTAPKAMVLFEVVDGPVEAWERVK